MVEGTPLNDILNDEPVLDVVEAPEAEAAPETPEAPETASDGPLRGADGKFIPKQTTGVEDTVPPTDKLPKEDYKAIREEREKRQSLERELEALRQQFQQAQEPAAPPPSIWDDDQAALQHSQQQAVSQATYMARLDMSEMLAAQAHEDFDDMKAKFIELMTLNPALQQEALQAKHPWEKAYQIAKNAASAAELGATNVDDLKAKLREEIMAEMQQEQVPLRPTVPPSLTAVRNVGTRSGPAWAGPASLSDLLG